MVREDVLQRATGRNWTRAAAEDSASSMSRSTSWAIRAPWCCFSMKSSCFCLLCSFLSCVCALILMHSMNSFFTLFLLLYFHPYFYYYYLVGIFSHLILDSFTILDFYVMYVVCNFFVKHLVRVIFLFGSTWSCISCMKGAIENSLLLACLQENATVPLIWDTITLMWAFQWAKCDWVLDNAYLFHLQIYFTYCKQILHTLFIFPT